MFANYLKYIKYFNFLSKQYFEWEFEQLPIKQYFRQAFEQLIIKLILVSSLHDQYFAKMIKNHPFPPQAKIGFTTTQEVYIEHFIKLLKHFTRLLKQLMDWTLLLPQSIQVD